MNKICLTTCSSYKKAFNINIASLWYKRLLRNVGRYQKENQKLLIEEQTTQWRKEKEQK